MAATPNWLTIIEMLFNRGIESSMQATALARRLSDTSLTLEIEGLPPVRAAVAAGRLILKTPGQPERHDDANADATVTGSPMALLQLGRNTPPRRGSFTAVTVHGDAEIANSYRELFTLARPDLEEEMARVVGDIPARRLSQLAAQTMGWARRARRTAGENTAEYLEEESRNLVNKPELEEFLRGVDALRETADRVEARLMRLERQLKDSR